MNYKDMEWVLKDKPSEYAARHCFYGAKFSEQGGLAGIDDVAKNTCSGQRLPALRGTFPYNLESLQLTFADMPDARRRKVLGENAAKLYRFDLDKLRPLADKHGPTPAQIDRRCCASRFRAIPMCTSSRTRSTGSELWPCHHRHRISTR